ncbi:AAA family ATPase [Streptomyces sp. NPDC047009]|uniref:AAA family ATPase n=1 Tax=Streptomyces sp. NPDC047009 TaxID=3154496 RepID=UPI0033E2F994
MTEYSEFEQNSLKEMQKSWATKEMVTKIITPVNGASDPAEDFLSTLRSSTLDTWGLDSIPDPVPLIDGILSVDSLAWLYGKKGSYKSFLAMDWAGCVSQGIPWNGRAVRQGKVLYLAAEGASGIRKRVRAWEEHHGTRMENVRFLPMVVALQEFPRVEAFARHIEELSASFVILDTQARCAVGFNENDNSDMSRLVDRLDTLRMASGACVLTLHHAGRSGENMRGASALDGAATSIMRLEKSEGEGIVTLKSEKQKDSEDFPSIKFTALPVLTSVVLTTKDQATTEAAKANENEMKVLRAMREAFEDIGASRTQIEKESEVPPGSMGRTLQSLKTRGWLRTTGPDSRPRYYLTEKGREIPLP